MMQPDRSAVDLPAESSYPTFMLSITAHELSINAEQLLLRVAEGEECLITRDGRVVARLSPVPPSSRGTVDWSKSPAMRDRSQEKMLTAEESQALIADAGGKW